MKYNIILALGCLAGALASKSAPRVLHESREAKHQLSQWQKLDKLPPDTIVPVRLALKQGNTDRGKDLLIEISNHTSEKYGQHLTQEQIVELFAPANESINAVKSWLVASGISSGAIKIPKSKGWLYFDATVAQLEAALNTEYHVYNHLSSGSSHFGTHEYSLPLDVSEHVDFIMPAVAMAHLSNNTRQPTRKRASEVERALPATQLYGSDQAACNASQILPACIQYLYQFPNNTKADPRNIIGIYEAADSLFSQSNLNLFYKDFYPRIPQGFGPQIDSIDGATTAQSPSGGETDLDVQMIMPIVYPQNAVMYQTNVSFDEFAELGLYNRFLDAIDGTYCNYSAYGETGDDPVFDGNLTHPDCTTVVSASGDDGARGDACIGDDITIFAPDQSSGCPWILSVGGTGLPDNYKPGDQEVAPHGYLPGGGWSNIHLRPDYQEDAVSEYFKNHDPNIPFYHTKDGDIPLTGGSYNRDGRAYPDISAISENGVTITTGGVVRLDNAGTSMAAPIVAALISRINEERLSAGKGLVGFVNPVFYAHPEMFNDITFSPLKVAPCNETGYLEAVKGWDPMTGLGTPNYPAMLEVFMNLK
ncbi:Pro-kumamolisin [Trichoderma harzianum]|uniref:Pro-kumamolisin n=1 Tax=Trichoderma harzianum TaxID=5544 RepID=A0A0F9ZCI3_TRIHA|nr:Pro-kumamolisin [Trichoderma harzianum]